MFRRITSKMCKIFVFHSDLPPSTFIPSAWDFSTCTGTGRKAPEQLISTDCLTRGHTSASSKPWTCDHHRMHLSFPKTYFLCNSSHPRRSTVCQKTQDLSFHPETARNKKQGMRLPPAAQSPLGATAPQEQGMNIHVNLRQTTCP